MTVTGLFFLGLVSPGPNFLVVVESTLSYDRRGGMLTDLGAAILDAIYASAGLFGMAVLIERGGYILCLIKACGGLYLVWLGLKMAVKRGDSSKAGVVQSSDIISLHRLFLRGLATDLSNPKTVAFFARIFAFAVHGDTPRTARAAMLLSICLTSVIWRIFLSVVFSTPFIRGIYQRSQKLVEPLFGAILCLLGVRLLKDAFAAFRHLESSLANGAIVSLTIGHLKLS